MLDESTTDDPHLDTETTTITETRDVGRYGAVTTTREVNANPSYDPQKPRQISFLSPTMVVEADVEPGSQRRDTRVRVQNLISGVRNPGMRGELERDVNSGSKPRMSTVANHMIGAYNEQRRKTRNYQIVGAIIFVLLAISIASNLGTSWYSVVANKETKTETVAAVPDAYAVNGSNTTTHKVFTDMDGVALRTDRSLDRMKLTSELPDDAWANLEQLHIKGSGGAIHFDVLGWARFNGDKSRCGTVVMVYTIAGNVQFDGTGMTFSNDVAGAFVRAGFRVSTGRRERQVNAAGYTLTGIQEVFGAFSFVAKLDTSNLSCGDDVPNITNNPFAGLVDNFYLVESHLYTCDKEGRPDCPSNSEVFTILDQSYYKRTKHTRAKKLGDTWVFVARTIVPEASGAGVKAGSRANVLVEMSNGTHVMSYTEFSFEQIGSDGPEEEPFEEDGTPVDEIPLQCFWNRTLEKTVRALPFVDNAEETGGVLDFVMDFVGYDVMNGEYVRHYTLTAKNQSALESENITKGEGKLMLNMFESYEKNRLYSLGFFAPLYYSTYDIIDTNPASDVLQGPNMPPLPTTAEEVSTWLSTTTCPGGVGENSSLLHFANNAQQAAVIADMFQVPDIAKYNSAVLYTDEIAEAVRLQRAMAIAKDAAEVLLSLNGTNVSDIFVNSTAGGGRLRRDLNSGAHHDDEQEQEHETETRGIGNIDLVVPEGMAFALARHIEEGSDFDSDQICGAKASCRDLFSNVSTACCNTKTSCRKCLGHLNVQRPADSTSELATAMQAHTRQRRARVGFYFKMPCKHSIVVEGNLWPNSPIKHTMETCKTLVQERTIIQLPYCKPEGPDEQCSCYYVPMYHGMNWENECHRYYNRIDGVRGGLTAKGYLTYINPPITIEGNLWIEAERALNEDNNINYGGQLEVGIKFDFIGTTFHLKVLGGFLETYANSHLTFFAGEKSGCCGISGFMALYLTWTPGISVAYDFPDGRFVSHACVGWGWLSICSTYERPFNVLDSIIAAL